MIGSLVGMFVRGVPAHLAAGLNDGTLKLFGSIIRNASNGQIAGFLQETGVGQYAALAMGNPGLAVGKAALDLGLKVTTVVQNEQIKRAVATLHNLQLGSLALGVAGIGVSVVGFAVMSAKIEGVRRQVDGLGERIDTLARSVELLRQEVIATDFDRLRTVVEQVDEGFVVTDPAAQWRDAAMAAHELANRFERRAKEVLGDKPVFDTVEPFAAAHALASAVRVSARLAAGDEAAARIAADGAAKTARDLTGNFGIADLASQTLLASGVEAGTAGYARAIEAAHTAAAPVIATARAREAAALSTPLTLAELERRGIAGRGWLEAARAESEEPVLLLEAA